MKFMEIPIKSELLHDGKGKRQKNDVVLRRLLSHNQSFFVYAVKTTSLLTDTSFRKSSKHISVNVRNFQNKKQFLLYFPTE